MTAGSIECSLIRPDHEPALSDFFRMLEETGASEFFHPHPMTPEEAHRRANYQGKDLYYVVTENGEVVGYGMLRGWDEGYAIPSLGIAIAPKLRGTGAARALMMMLHLAAKRRAARRVRLKVDRANHRAVALYRSLHYVFEDAGPDLIGHLDLEEMPRASEADARDT